MFQNPRIQVRVLPTGEDGRSAALHVLERLDEFQEQNELEPDDELWLVIDVDHLTEWALKEVCRLAEQKNVSVALSNPCFELWIWLHFADLSRLPESYEKCTTARRCREIEKALRNLLGTYNKANLRNELFDEAAFAAAVARAEALDSRPEDRRPNHPGTRVYRLVRRILAS